ncbi:MAG: hypothetical protein IRY99_11775 [Isosphaeraceae bacterium]|nr:hypothetical protein [Isosphaeraceae bacterium]
MMVAIRSAALALLGAALLALPARAAEDPLSSLKKGTPALQSAGPLAFGPEGILFVGDTKGAAVFAIDTGDRTGKTEAGELKVDEINEKIAAMLGTKASQILINDLAVNPASGKAYLSVSRGKGPDAAPVIIRVSCDGKLEALNLENVPYAKADLPSPPDAQAQARGMPLRNMAITDMAYVDGRVFVAGLSNEEFSSRLLAIPFPFGPTPAATSVEIYHGSHGRLETKSPVRTFTTYKINGADYLMAAYTCTPLVKLPVSDLKPGAHIKGTTVAELGNRNNPLDMIVYRKDGKDYLLLANSSRGVMKITTDGIDRAEAITKPIPGTAGQKYETIASLKGVLQLDALDPGHALILVQQDGGAQDLETVALP